MKRDAGRFLLMSIKRTVVSLYAELHFKHSPSYLFCSVLSSSTLENTSSLLDS